ncbi:MAG: 50S ribosomal protein L18 [Phycisphaera sp.]|nr:50S ribosomal protein L18 [Phycisphaera sp.]
MSNTLLNEKRRVRRKAGIRKHVIGTPERPRLTVFRSIKYVYAQVIDDYTGKTLVAASSVKSEKGSNKAAAAAVGKELAEKARAAGVTHVAFDRNAFKYHGRVKALADAAREAGLKF